MCGRVGRDLPLDGEMLLDRPDLDVIDLLGDALQVGVLLFQCVETLLDLVECSRSGVKIDGDDAWHDFDDHGAYDFADAIFGGS
jgi:hypothetical protein